MSDPSQEDEYFARLDREKTAALKAKMNSAAEEQAAADLRELHWHRCGKCGSSMDAHNFRGVEIEVCPNCGATLLDRGELKTLAGQDNTGVLRSLLSVFGAE